MKVMILKEPLIKPHLHAKTDCVDDINLEVRSQILH